jgi:acyl carrier protein phosphodiesterase
MNFLAHTFLSGDSDEVRIGNFIGDYVKGSDFKLYAEGIRKGIILHRHIDSFTDSHPVVRESISRLVPLYHKYAGVIIDIFYDHFLSVNWDFISSVPLADLAELTYRNLHDHYDILPEEIKKVVPSFIFNRWLEAYNTIEGIETVLRKMSVVTSLPDLTAGAIRSLEEFYEDYQNEFFAFFPDIVHYVSTAFDIHLFLSEGFLYEYEEAFRKRG